MWTGADIRVEVFDDLSEADAVTVRLQTPAGLLAMMADVRFEGRVLILTGVHTHGEDIGPGSLGPVRLRWLAQAVMEVVDCDEIILEGAIRTTGAGPGRRPGRLRFRRPPAAGPRD
ncbi:hypothetical protein [Caenispirillum bisanense]|uniref:hypothetical protein n=1 Tax=Caenispirillum bisanense TaxID=414052 RepID=UPI0031D815B3